MKKLGKILLVGMGIMLIFFIGSCFLIACLNAEQERNFCVHKQSQEECEALKYCTWLETETEGPDCIKK